MPEWVTVLLLIGATGLAGGVGWLFGADWGYKRGWIFGEEQARTRTRRQISSLEDAVTRRDTQIRNLLGIGADDGR